MFRPTGEEITVILDHLLSDRLWLRIVLSRWATEFLFPIGGGALGLLIGGPLADRIHADWQAFRGV